MANTLQRTAVAVLLWLITAAASAQSVDTRDAVALSLEDLLSVQVVTTASKFPQAVREAPASITIVTAEDIQRYGHRTLADVLRTVRGLYTTYDRNYEYVGVRGFARPGDYNTRVLLLLNGHRLNDALYDMAPIGTDFPLDVSVIDRVEIIRGPASSLYGTNALFGIINVVTRTGGQHSGLRLTAAGGSQSSYTGAASYGRLFRGGSELLLAGSASRSDGDNRLSYPEYAGVSATNGLALDLDGDRSRTFFASFRTGNVSVSGGMAGRRKRVPTAAFSTTFGDDRFVTTDNRYYLRAEYERRLGAWTLTTRGSFDEYYYDGTYPFEDGTLWRETSATRTLAGEAGIRRRVGKAHLISTGVEVLGHVKNDLTAISAETTAVDIRTPGTTWAIYGQDEFKPVSWLILNGGVRFDHSKDFGSRATPRLGVVVLPTQRTTFKFLHGRAFRAPNTYELEYYALMRDNHFTLRPESIRSSELVWEEYLASWLRTAVTGFQYQIDDVIELRTQSSDGELFFANGDDISGRGLELEVEAKGRGVTTSWSHTYVRTRAPGSAEISNSPSHLSKFQVQFVVSSVSIAADLQYLGGRRVRSGDRLGPALIPNFTISRPVNRRLELSASVYNASSSAYADPGGEEHLQQSIPQDGATALLRARLRF